MPKMASVGPSRREPSEKIYAVWHWHSLRCGVIFGDPRDWSNRLHSLRHGVNLGTVLVAEQSSALFPLRGNYRHSFRRGVSIGTSMLWRVVGTLSLRSLYWHPLIVLEQ